MKQLTAMFALTQKLCGVPPARVSILKNQDHDSLRGPHEVHEEALTGRVELHCQLAPPISIAPQEPTPLIHRLPVELYGEIFKHYLDDTHPDNLTANVSSLKSTTFARFNPIILGHVCSYWRAIALSIPTLWSSIAVLKPTSSQFPMIQLWLERAADCPLSIVIFQGHVRDADGHLVPSSPRATEDVLQLFLACVRQWRRIEFHVNDKSLYNSFLNLSPSIFAMLQDVDVDMRHLNHALVNQVWQRFHSLPSLRRVSWDNFYLNSGIPTHAPLAQLTHIKMDYVAGLTMSALLEMLRQCQSLRFLKCAIIVPWGDDVSFEAAPVVLPQLRAWHIDAEGSGHPGPFLSHITLPSLISLIISHRFCSKSPIRLFPYLQDLLVRSACSLEDLSLCDSVMTEAELLRVLEKLPQVQTVRRLDLLYCPLTERTFNLLAQSKDGRTRILPRLRELTLPRCQFSGDMVSAIVAARSPQLESIRMACQCLLGRPPTHDLNYLRSLQSAGHDFQFGIYQGI